MNVLVTGGAGFIGSHVVEHYLNHGHEVFVIDNLSTGNRENIPFVKAENFFEEDICDLDLVGNIIKEYQFDLIIHLAAVVSVVDTINNPVDSNEVNITATLNLLESNRLYNNNIKRIIFASSAAVYGNNTQLPNSIMKLVNPISPYAIQKYAGEQYVKQYSNLYDIPTTALRFFNVYGPRQDPKSAYSGVLSIMQSSYLDEKPFTFFGDGTQTRDFVYVKDVVQAISLVADSDNAIGHVFNVGTGKPSSLMEVFEFLGNVLEKDISTNFVNEREGDIKHSYADIQELSNLGYFPKYSIEEGLYSYINESTKKEIGV
ncbi:NAD-dependent dehydratase [Mammaliicoccus vitulinus]|uniref:NAD-dependent dehydratase n=1 Tax=Mammaliicoccus vitulinus TaxID=71237 RepID=A0A2T4PQE7_9STAP|nr:NAD-dependent epimerase/dehydratase family protein [Mammaliicoccus vitulinus]PTI27867.1 NAD-dependent dehydratase [Mammaliicoccus vitulinus]